MDAKQENPGEIYSEISKIETLVHDVGVVCEELDNRLKPVTAPIPPSVMKDETNDMRTGLGGILQRIRKQLHGHFQTLVILRDNLEI